MTTTNKTSGHDIIVRVTSDARVRVLPGQGFDHTMAVSFPKHLRTPGDRFSCTVELAAGGKHLRAQGRTIKRMSNTAMPAPAAVSVPAPAKPAPARVPVPAPRVLEADEVIDGGGDAAFAPSASPRHAYRQTANGNTVHGQALKAAAVDHSGDTAQWPAFVREVFCVLFDEAGTPPLPEQERSPWAARAVDMLKAQPEWDRLRAASQVSRVVAAGACVALVDAVAGLTKAKAEHDAGDLEDYRDTWAAFLDGAGATPGQIATALVDVDEEVRAAHAADAKAAQHLDASAGSVRRAMLDALADAEAAADAVRMSVGLGFNREGPGSLAEVCPELLSELREDARVTRILSWVGRFRDHADGALARTRGMASIVDLSLTGDLARVTPDVRVRLAAPGVLGTMALLDVLEEQALGFEGEAHEPVADGELVILYDRSGSMSGGADEQARALAIAALLACYRQHRRVVLVTFAATGDNEATTLVPGDHTALAACIRVLCRPSDGCGTDVEDAIRTAMKAAPKKPDVLVLTDGVFPKLADKTIEGLGDARVFGVFIDECGAAAHPEFTAGWDVRGEIDPATAAQVINALRKPRKQTRKVA